MKIRALIFIAAQPAAIGFIFNPIFALSRFIPALFSPYFYYGRRNFCLQRGYLRRIIIGRFGSVLKRVTKVF